MCVCVFLISLYHHPQAFPSNTSSRPSPPCLYFPWCCLSSLSIVGQNIQHSEIFQRTPPNSRKWNLLVVLWYCPCPCSIHITKGPFQLFFLRLGGETKHCPVQLPGIQAFLSPISYRQISSISDLPWVPKDLNCLIKGEASKRQPVALLSLSHVQLFATLCTAACQSSLTLIISQACSDSCPPSRWCHPTISFSVALLLPSSLSQHQDLF